MSLCNRRIDVDGKHALNKNKYHRGISSSSSCPSFCSVPRPTHLFVHYIPLWCVEGTLDCHRPGTVVMRRYWCAHLLIHGIKLGGVEGPLNVNSAGAHRPVHSHILSILSVAQSRYRTVVLAVGLAVVVVIVGQIELPVAALILALEAPLVIDLLRVWRTHLETLDGVASPTTPNTLTEAGHVS
jgi:hypothetical protein